MEIQRTNEKCRHLRSPQAVLVGIGKPGTMTMAEILTEIGNIEDFLTKIGNIEDFLTKIGKVDDIDKNRQGRKF